MFISRRQETDSIHVAKQQKDFVTEIIMTQFKDFKCFEDTFYFKNAFICINTEGTKTEIMIYGATTKLVNVIKKRILDELKNVEAQAFYSDRIM